MIRFMIQKLLHKKWMVISLLIGNILLIAIACSNPMYKNASLQRTLTKQFSDYIDHADEYPGVVTLESSMTKGASSKSEYGKMAGMADTILSDIGLKATDYVRFASTMKSNASSLMEREDNLGAHTMRVVSLTGIDEHINIMAGRMYSNDNKDGVFEAIVSQKTFVQANLILDEKMEFPNELDANGKPIEVKVVGVFTNSRTYDPYWIKSPSDYDTECFISQDLFDSQFINPDNQIYNIETFWYDFFDYSKIKPVDVSSIIKKTNEYVNENNSKLARVEEPEYIKILKDFKLSQNKIVTTLLILQVPVLVLLCAFIFMISRQMLDLEKNEMALLKSRGSSKWQIISIYFLQSVIVTMVSIVIGLPLGSFLCRILGSANGFLEFVQRSSLNVSFDGQVLLYCIGAAFVSVGVMVLPVFRYADVTIVNYKQKKNRKTKPLWQRVYLDVIMLCLSLYGLYSFNDRKDTLMVKMLSGSSIDPLLFLCASLFIISAGLVALRIQPLIVNLVFLIGKKLWHPAEFASFLQILRTRGKQSFMMVFLMLTVSLGIYNATVARTILSNARKSVKYENGADIVLKEVWKDNSAFLKYSSSDESSDDSVEDTKLVYTEPDCSRYDNLGEVNSLARVLKDDVTISKGRKGVDELSSKVMGINTKEFGETIDFDSSIMPAHINTYLNVLASNSDAVLLSMNYHTKQKYEIGDTISYVNKDGVTIDSVVYGFVDYWPSYIPRSYNLNDEGVLDTTDNYMIIANLSRLQESWGITPYQIWLKTNGTSDFIYDYAEKNNIQFQEFHDSESDMVEIRNNTLFQGTNGILTMSFIVVLILCSAGFLIYWIISIRSRELLFGVFRAMGMRKVEIIQMLVNEQIFSTGISITIGTVIGLAASRYFVPLVQIFYSTTEQTIPLTVVRNKSDMIRLFGVIGVVILVCMIILGILITKIKISQALKLGED